MKSANKRKYWTLEDVEILLNAKKQGKRLKEIAKMLNTSDIAISKALQRYRYYHKDRFFNIKSNRAVSNDNRRKHYVNDREAVLLRQWVNIEAVIEWLSEYSGSETTQIPIVTLLNNNVLERRYRWNSQWLNAAQLLYLVNYLRRRADLPIFYVKDVSGEQ